MQHFDIIRIFPKLYKVDNVAHKGLKEGQNILSKKCPHWG